MLACHMSKGTGAMPAACWIHTASRPRSPLEQVPDYKVDESVYKTRWMPPAKPVGI